MKTTSGLIVHEDLDQIATLSPFDHLSFEEAIAAVRDHLGGNLPIVTFVHVYLPQENTWQVLSSGSDPVRIRINWWSLRQHFGPNMFYNQYSVDLFYMLTEAIAAGFGRSDAKAISERLTEVYTASK